MQAASSSSSRDTNAARRPAVSFAASAADAPEIACLDDLLARLATPPSHIIGRHPLAATGAMPAARLCAAAGSRLAATEDDFAIRVRDMLMPAFAPSRSKPCADMVHSRRCPAAQRRLYDGTLGACCRHARPSRSDVRKTAGEPRPPALLGPPACPASASIRSLPCALRALCVLRPPRPVSAPTPMRAAGQSAFDDVRRPREPLTAWPSDALAAARGVIGTRLASVIRRPPVFPPLSDGDVAVSGARAGAPFGSFHLFVTELISGDSLADAAVFSKFLTHARSS